MTHLKSISWNMDGGTAENHGQPQFGKLVPYLRYEPSTSICKSTTLLLEITCLVIMS
jgi:hypothetical protein